MFGNHLTIYGEDHTKSYRAVINDLIRYEHRKRPFNFLVLEEIGPEVYLSNEEKLDAIKREAYSVGPMGLELAIELNIPAIGMDLWDDDTYKDDKFGSDNFAIDVVRSFRLRELNMVRVLKKYYAMGNVVAIVGDTHLRRTETTQLGPASPLYTEFQGLDRVSIVRCFNTELD